MPNDPSLSYLLLIIGFLWGSCLGSFAAALIWRIPRYLPWVYDAKSHPPGFVRSICPDCGKVLRPTELIPILSWVLMKGRCRRCTASISPVYPVTELTCAVIGALVFYFFGFTVFSVVLSFLLLFLGIFLVCGFFMSFWSVQALLIAFFLGLGLFAYEQIF